MRKDKKALIFLGVLLLCGVAFLSVKAQESSPYRILLSWGTDNFYPSNYEGKSLPSDGSPVHISLLLLKNGKIIDAGDFPIKWYINNRYFAGGKGLSSIGFITDETKGSPYTIKASLQTENGDAVNEFIQVPIVQKELVLESSAINGKIPPNSSATFTAVPYFFNIESITDLDIRWKIQGQNIANEKKQNLFIQFGEPKTEAQRAITISAVADDKSSIFTSIADEIKIRIEQ